MADERGREVRIAVVMTGGVSLAVWMGGVATEIHRVACDDGVYGEILRELRSTAVVDVITGSSAGGLNGVALAYALAQRLPAGTLDGLADVWRNDGGVEALMRSPFEPDPPSLFRGDDYFLHRIDEALSGLAGRDLTGSTPAESEAKVHLTVTATTLDGEPEPFLDDFGNRIDQSTHRATFTFDESGLLAPGAAARLALAARTSSSFPGAFEPSFVPVGAKGPKGQPDMAGVASFGGNRFAVDGGVLNNQPINHAIDRVFGQPASGPVRRLMLYVNPDPGLPAAPTDAEPSDPPPLAKVVTASLSSLPRHETVANDLRAIQAHNRQVEQQRLARRNSLRANHDVVELAARPEIYGDFLDERTRSSVRATSARIVARAPSIGLDPARAEAAQRALERAAREPDVWMPASLTGAWTNERWPWGISPIEYAISTVSEALRGALDDVPPTAGTTAPVAVTVGQRQDASALRTRLSAEIDRLRAIRQLDDTYWHVCALQLLRAETTDLDAWAEACYRRWPVVPRAEVSELRRIGRRQVANYEARLESVERELLAPDRDHLEQGEVRAALGRRALAVAAIATDAARALAPGRPRDVVMTQLAAVAGRAADEPDAVAAVERWLLALFISQVALGGAERPREQTVQLLQLSGNLGHLIDPASAGRSTAREKLTGVDLGHFGGFLKRSWRANDWMWGRLDGADRLILALLEPSQIERRAGGDVDEAVRIVRQLAGASPDDPPDGHRPDTLTRWYLDHEDEIRGELSFVGTAEPAPPALPACSRVVARRAHAEILRVELPSVAAAVEHSRDAGARSDADAAAFVRAVSRSGGDDRELDPAELADLLRLCRVNHEAVGDELGSNAMAQVTTQGAAVGAALLVGNRSGVGVLATPLRAVRWVLLAVYAIVRGAVDSGIVGALIVGAGLAASGTVVGLALAGVDIAGIWVAGAVVVLAVFTLLTVFASGAYGLLLPLGAVATVAIAFKGDALAAALVDPAVDGSWKATVLLRQEVTRRALAGLLGVAALVTFGAAVNKVADKGWRSGSVVRRLVAAAALGAAAFGALALDLEALLVGRDAPPWKPYVADVLTTLHEYRFAVVAVGLPAAVVLVEVTRRVPRMIENARWVIATTTFAPGVDEAGVDELGGWSRTIQVLGERVAREHDVGRRWWWALVLTVATTAIGALVTLLDRLDVSSQLSVGDLVRLALGVVAGWLVLGPPMRTPWWGLTGPPAPATRAAGQWFVAIGLPITVLWGFGLPRLDDSSPPSGLWFVLHLVLLWPCVAFVEEVLFRGVLLRAQSTGGHAVAGLWWSSVAFGLWNVLVLTTQLDRAVALVAPLGFVAMTAAGLVLGWLRIRTRSLIAPAALHGLVSSLLFVYAYTAQTVAVP